MNKYCEYCGAPLQEDAKFCTGCGHPVTRQSQPAQQPGSSQQAQQPRPQQQPRGGQQQGYPYGQQQASQQGNPYRQPSNQVNFQPSAQAHRPQQPKKKNGLMYALIGLVVIVAMAVSAVIVFPSLSPLGQKKDKKELAKSSQEKSKDGKTTSGKETPGKDEDGYRGPKLTKEVLEYLKNHPVVATPENSPGNPAFIEVTYSKEEYAEAPTYAALVTQDHPEVDFPDLGIHVNMKSWNLEFEQDSLIVKQLPDKVDETTGKILHSYDYSLVSKQHNFLTGVEFTAPVQGDPDAFAGFVTYNEATGQWEEVYCELSEDRRSFTAHLSHFSKGSALETIKTEGIAAIEKYKINGNSIFDQLPTEMQPKYDESEHYLYPVVVAESTDLEFFFNKQQKNKKSINKNILGKDYVPEKDIYQIVSEWFGYGSTASDIAGNAGGLVGAAKYTGLGFQNVSDGALSDVSSSCFVIGYAALALKIADQIAVEMDKKDDRDRDYLAIVDENRVAIASTLIGYIGMLASVAGEGTALFAAVGGGIAAGTVGTVAAVISAIVFACTANDALVRPIEDWIEKQVFDLKYPLGAPTSIAEAALQCYMQDYAHSENGYYRNKVSAWDWAWGRQESPEIDSAKVYALTPQKILDHNPKNWLAAYDCLVKHHVNNPRKMFEAYDDMFKNYVDAFWKEPTEVKKKYIRMACQRYIEVDMRYYLHNQGGTTEEPAMTVRGADVFYMPKLDTAVYRFTSEAESEWKEIQQDFINHATRLKKQERDSRPNDYRMAGKGSEVSEVEVWDAVFQEWDAAGVNNKELRYIGNPEEQKAFFHDKYTALFKYRLTPLLQDYYWEQYHKSIEEVRRLLNNQVLPLLNARLTFYAQKLSDKDEDIIKEFEADRVNQPIDYFCDSLPDFAFICDKKPQFTPGNYGEVKLGFPLVLKPNKKNAALLETTVYHYLMYDCPLEVEITPKDGSKPMKGNANWDGVKLVQDLVEKDKKARERANDYGVGTLRISNDPKAFQNDIADTQIPVEFKYDIDADFVGDRIKHNVQNDDFMPCVEYAIPNLRIILSETGDFEATAKGEYSGPLRTFVMVSSDISKIIATSESTVTISGNINKSTGKGTFTMRSDMKQTALTYYMKDGQKMEASVPESHPSLVVTGDITQKTESDKSVTILFSGRGKITSVTGQTYDIGEVDIVFKPTD